MNNVKELYDLWLKNTQDNKEVYDELLAVKDNENEIADRFYRNLEFGTAGLRGVLGAGTNRLNSYTVNQATQGLATYLSSEISSPSVAIAYDSRINSDVFAIGSACVLAANGIKTYLYPELVPTPMLSFAVRELKCSAGINITASHNPAKYNGYKCYDANGYQITDAAAAKIYGYIQNTDIFNDIKLADFENAVADGMIEYIGRDVYEKFYSAVISRLVNPDVCRNSDLKIIYTPLNGTGNLPVREVLDRIGFKDVKVVPEQELPDGNFPTCPFPNPEIRQAFECAIKLAESDRADLLLATDPDCDRVGIAILDDGEYKLLTGNEVGALLTEYLLSCRKANGTLPSNGVILKSFVTTKLIDAIAKDFNCTVVNLLTGFKYIGEYITKLEQAGEADRFILGTEESYGYLSGTHARDKDAVVGSMLICEMTAYYKSKGKTLIQVLDELARKYGVYLNTLLNFTFEGADGMERMKQIMTDLRKTVPEKIADKTVVSVSDYSSGETRDTITGKIAPIDLPKSNVVEFILSDGSGVIVRPSGTEPKIKLYITSVSDKKDDAVKTAESIGEEMKKLMGIC
ncbi:MAG: phospho-sugar mutase [Clostridiales bacterium]|nr:phospho-sugar mutase [Clostridiales bacterium]